MAKRKVATERKPRARRGVEPERVHDAAASVTDALPICNGRLRVIGPDGLAQDAGPAPEGDASL